jgi:hypothetical protein
MIKYYKLERYWKEAARNPSQKRNREFLGRAA